MSSKRSTAPTYQDTITTRKERDEAYRVAWDLGKALVREGKQNELGVRVVGRVGVFHVELHNYLEA